MPEYNSAPEATDVQAGDELMGVRAGALIQYPVPLVGASGAAIPFQAPASPLADTYIIFGSAGKQNSTNYVMTIDRLDFHPFLCPFDLTITDAAIDVNTGSAGTLYYGVVLLDADWQPNVTGIVGQSSFDIGTTGFIQDTTPSWTLTGGNRYAIWWVASAGATLGATQTQAYIGDGMAPIRNNMNWAWGTMSRSAVTAGVQSDPLPDYDTVLSENWADGLFTPIGMRFTV